MKEDFRYVVIGADDKHICTYGLGWSVTEIIEAHPEAKALCLADKKNPDMVISTVVVAELKALFREKGGTREDREGRVKIVMEATGCPEEKAIAYLEAEEWDCIDAVRSFRGDLPTRHGASA